VLFTVAPRFSLPVRSAYPLLAMIAVVLVWFGATRLQDLPGLAPGLAPGRVTGRAAGRAPGRAPGWVGRAGDDYARGDRYEANGRGGSGWDAGWPDRYEDGSGFGPGVPGGPGPAGRPQALLETAGAATALAGADREFGQQAKPAGSPAGKPATPYGRIVIFTLLEDRVADFDRLAEQTAEEVRTAEPDTLVYVIHLVPNAPMQRIFYEIYRDRAAFDGHENQPYMQRFVAERRSCVLATNVIELRLKYAKVAPLPYPQPADPAAQPAGLPAHPAGLSAHPAGLATQPGTLAQLPPRGGAALPPLPPGQPPTRSPAPPQGQPPTRAPGPSPTRSPAWSPGQVQTLDPLPPGPDRRRLPSAGRRYDGA
jgi:quinol monooxygenase YgiN